MESNEDRRGYFAELIKSVSSRGKTRSTRSVNGKAESKRRVSSKTENKRAAMPKDELSKLKISLCKRHGLKKIPSDFEIALNATPKERALLKVGKAKPMRTGSGVAVVAIMTSPSDCPHGRCTYCPGGMSSHFGDVPQSYTGKEPATLRGIRNDYDPYLQVFNRLEQYAILGHGFSKIELIIMGGTFMARDKDYRDEFVGMALKAMNDFSDRFFDDKGDFLFDDFKIFFELPADVSDNDRSERIKAKTLKLKRRACVLKKEQERNENSWIRCVAMCIETRPDYCSKKDIDEMLRLGCTRVEMGVQSLDDKTLSKVERGNSVADSVDATMLMKDSLLKVGYHMMPGLPGSSEKKDLAMLKQLFADSRFRPDALKLYPCMVMPGTKLYDDYVKGRFKPMGTKEAAKLIAEFKRYVPEYCRIMRVQRDIPSTAVSAGVDRTNLRQYVDIEMKKRGIQCRCIRCREPKGDVDASKIRLKETRYAASEGEEIFIAAEADDMLAGFARLRFLAKPYRKELSCAGIRELHVYGEMAALGKKGNVQHRGIGKMLMERAEQIAVDKGCRSIAVISGIGVREYYKKLGYELNGPYMVKPLN